MKKKEFIPDQQEQPPQTLYPRRTARGWLETVDIDLQGKTVEELIHETDWDRGLEGDETRKGQNMERTSPTKYHHEMLLWGETTRPWRTTSGENQNGSCRGDLPKANRSDGGRGRAERILTQAFTYLKKKPMHAIRTFRALSPPHSSTDIKNAHPRLWHAGESCQDRAVVYATVAKGPSEVLPWTSILPAGGPHSETLAAEKLGSVEEFDSVDLLGIYSPDEGRQQQPEEGEQPRLRFVRHSNGEAYVYCNPSTPTRWGRPQTEEQSGATVGGTTQTKLTQPRMRYKRTSHTRLRMSESKKEGDSQLGRPSTAMLRESFVDVKGTDQPEWPGNNGSGRTWSLGRRRSSKRCASTGPEAEKKIPVKRPDERRSGIGMAGTLHKTELNNDHNRAHRRWVQDVNGQWFEVKLGCRPTHTTTREQSMPTSRASQ